MFEGYCNDNEYISTLRFSYSFSNFDLQNDAFIDLRIMQRIQNSMSAISLTTLLPLILYIIRG